MPLGFFGGTQETITDDDSGQTSLTRTTGFSGPAGKQNIEFALKRGEARVLVA